MSKNISIFHRNYLRQPHIKELAPDIKLTLIAINIECESAVGCWIPSSIDDVVNIKNLGGAFDELERRGELSVDKKTGEFFLTSFFRNNHFVGAKRIGQARAAFDLISSERLRMEILEQVKLNHRFCKLRPEDLEPPKSAPPSFLVPKKPPPVDNLGGDPNIQQDTYIVEEEVKVKVKEEVEDEQSSCANFPFFSAQEQNKMFDLDVLFDQLMNRAGLVKDGNRDRDRESIMSLRELCTWIDCQTVFAAISDCLYPSQAVKNAKAAGLFDDADSKKKGKMADRPLCAEALAAIRNGEVKLRHEMQQMTEQGKYSAKSIVN
jgi:hypothetical protein